MRKNLLKVSIDWADSNGMLCIGQAHFVDNEKALLTVTELRKFPDHHFIIELSFPVSSMF